MTFTGYIYRITGACGKCYYGSTICIKNRKSDHKNKIQCSSQLLQKPIILDVIDTREYKLIKTLRLVEQFYMDNNECVNKRRAYRNKKKYNKQYYIENKQKLKINSRKNYNENKQIRKITSKKYNDNHKEERKRRDKIIFLCVCGRNIQICEKARHLRSKFHINYVSNN